MCRYLLVVVHNRLLGRVSEVDKEWLPRQAHTFREGLL